VWLIHEGLRIGQNSLLQWINLPWILPGVKKTKGEVHLHLVLKLTVRGAVPQLPLRIHCLIYYLMNRRIETGWQCNITKKSCVLRMKVSMKDLFDTSPERRDRGNRLDLLIFSFCILC